MEDLQFLSETGPLLEMLNFQSGKNIQISKDHSIWNSTGPDN